jgi:hypothetical protein
MKCKKSTEDCILELKFYENGDVFEFCTVCSFSYLHKFDKIGNNHLSLNNKKN